MLKNVESILLGKKDRLHAEVSIKENHETYQRSGKTHQHKFKVFQTVTLMNTDFHLPFHI